LKWCWGKLLLEHTENGDEKLFDNVSDKEIATWVIYSTGYWARWQKRGHMIDKYLDDGECFAEMI